MAWRCLPWDNLETEQGFIMRKGLRQWRPVLLGAFACGSFLADVPAQDVDALAIPIRKGSGEDKAPAASSSSRRTSSESKSSEASGKRSSSRQTAATDASRRSFYTSSVESPKSSSAEKSSRSSNNSSTRSSASSESRNSSSSSQDSDKPSDADLAAVASLRSYSESKSRSSSEKTEQAGDEDAARATAAKGDSEPSSEPGEQANASSTEMVSVPGPATQLPQTPYVPIPAARQPQPNLYVQPSTESRGLLSRLFGRRKVTPTSTVRVPTNFTSDYTKRDPNLVLPAVLAGNGINGKDIPIGSEDSYRLASALPTDFRPTDLVQLPKEYCHYGNQLYLRSEAAASLCQMIYDAQCQGLNIEVVSAFRDYGHQLRLYNQAVARRGANQKTVAKPGRSEHFLGTTVDLTNSKEHTLKRSFGDTPEGRWLAANAHRYGWKMTVMSGNGRRSHNDEPWHLRYLGSSVNTYSRNSAIAQTQPQPQPPRDVMGKIGRFLGLRR